MSHATERLKQELASNTKVYLAVNVCASLLIQWQRKMQLKPKRESSKSNMPKNQWMHFCGEVEP